MKRLNIGMEIEVPRGTEAPMIDGQPMSVGDLLVRIVPVVQSGSDYMRAMNLGLEIDKALGAGEEAIDLRTDDVQTLRKVCIDMNQHHVWGANWAKWNLNRAFDAAEEVEA